MHNSAFNEVLLQLKLYWAYDFFIYSTGSLAGYLDLAKVADFNKPMMALFDNLIAADLKKGNNIMFIMVSGCCFQVAPQADGGLGGQLACAGMYYGVFSTILNITKGGCGCCFGDEKGFNVGINIRLRRVRYFPPQPLTTMVFPTWQHHRHWCCRIHTVGPHSGNPRARTPSIHHGQCRCALVWSNSSDWQPRSTKTANKTMWMMTKRVLWQWWMLRLPSTTTLRPLP